MPETEVTALPVNSHFRDFLKAYPSMEDRYEAAQQIAVCNDVNGPPPDAEMPETNFTGRNILLSHWGDDELQLENIFDFMYRLWAGLGQMQGKQVMVFQRGTYMDLVKREDFAAFDTGVVNAVELIQGYASRREQRLKKVVDANGHESEHYTGRAMRGVVQPYLYFTVSIPVKDAYHVEADVVGEPEVRPLTDTEHPEATLKVLLGAVTLLPDEPLYQKTRNTEMYRCHFDAPMPSEVAGSIEQIGQLAVAGS